MAIMTASPPFHLHHKPSGAISNISDLTITATEREDVGFEDYKVPDDSRVNEALADDSQKELSHKLKRLLLALEIALIISNHIESLDFLGFFVAKSTLYR